MPVTATRTTIFRPGPTGDQDSDGFVDIGDILRHTLVIDSTGTDATNVAVNDPLNGSTLTGNVNVSPLAFNDSFDAVGNTLLEVGNATAQTGPQSSFAGSVLTNDVEFLGDSFEITAFDATSANGGTISMVTTGPDAGSFTYISDDGFTGTDTFTYTIRDDGLDGIAGNADDLTSTATVSINVAGQVWYVEEGAVGGDGTSTNPFGTVTAAGAASGANDFVHVRGNATGTIALDAGEQLIGTGVDLVVGTATLFTALGPANSSVANNSGAGFTVTLGTNNTIAGIDILATGGAGGGALTGTGFGTLAVSDVALDATGQALSLTTGAISGPSTGFNSTDSDGGTNNVNIQSVTGNLNLGGGALSGATGSAVVINGGNGSVDYNGTVTHGGNAAAIQVLNKTGGSVDFDGSVTSNTASDGVVLASNTGATINFDGGLVIDTSSSNSAGFTATGGGTVTVTDNGTINNSVTSGTGTALNLNGVTVGNTGILFETVSTSGGANGILIDTVGQTGSSTGIDITGGSIVNASTRGVDINATSADVSIAATISTTATGRSVEVTNSGRNVAGGSTINFSGGINDDGLGINLDNNDQNTQGATISFTSGALDIDTAGANRGFNAVNGGTVNVTGASNSIVTTTGIALNVDNTSIGASDLTFRDISSTGAPSGIVLNNTGTGGGAGGLTVTGTGGANSGGTIQNSTGDGISITNARDVSFTELRILNSADNNISATNVTNLGFNSLLSDGSGGTNFLGSNITALTISNLSAFDNSGNAAGEHGVFITGLFGISSITNTTFNRSAETQFKVSNTTGTVAQGGIAGDVINMSGVTFGNLVAPTFGDNIQINSDVTANMRFNLTNTSGANSIDGGITGILINASSGGDIDVDISNVTVTNGTGVGINFNPVGAGSRVWFDVHDTTITNRGSSGLNATSINNSIIEGIFNNNTITQGAVGSGINIVAEGQGGANSATATIVASNNTITGVQNGAGISAQARVGGTLNLTLDNNHVNINNGLNLEGIRVISGSSGAGDVNNIVRLNMLNNDSTVGAASGQEDYLLQVRTTNVFQLQNFTGNGNNTDTVDESNWVINLKDNNRFDGVTNPIVQFSHTSGGVFTATAGNVPLPSLPTPMMVLTPPPAPDEPSGKGDGTGGELVPTTVPTNGDLAPAASPAGPVVVDDGILSQAELNLIVEAAIDRWAAAGATDEQLAAMRATTISVQNLAGLHLGSSTGGLIALDDNAAGWNWFIDATPDDDSEYSGTGTQLRAADANSASGTRIDLLTVVMHELGHQIGLTDISTPGEGEELMFGTIGAGERRLPGEDDHEGGGGAPVTGLLALTPINIGTIPAGRSVTVQWDSVVDPFGAGTVPTFNNASNVTGNNPGAFNVDSNTETLSPTSAPLALDSLTLGSVVFFDANNSGSFDAGEGVDGVTLTLFVDTNANGVFDAGTDAQVATTTTAGGGVYSFINLAPGDYIVRVDAANFNAGGALVGRVTAAGASDPDDNADNDDNGVNGAGGIVVSQAITLAHNTETTADGTGQLDINDTLDFGFIELNDPPVNTVPGTQTINEDTTLTFTGGTAISVADSDVGAGNLTVTVSVVNGQLTLSGTAGLVFGSGDGTDDTTMTFSGTQAAVNAALNGLLYEPTLDNNGSDTLTITTNDNGNTGTDPGTSGGANDEEDTDTVTINISAVVDIVGDSVTVGEDSGANNLDLLGNDNFENPGRFISSVTQGANGSVTIDDNGTVGDTTDDFAVYTPDADFNGADSFDYTVTSGGVTETATVNVTVNAAADIADDAATTNEDTAVNVLVLANDSFDATPAITNVGAAANGTAVLNDNGTAGDTTDDFIVYTPNADYNGGDSFTYQVTSGGVTETATVNVTINAVADIADDNVSVVQDSGVNNLDLLANDTFEDPGRAITAVGAAANGVTAIDDNGTAGDATDDFVTYTPNAGYFGPDTFTYTVTSGGVTENAMVTVDVTPPDLAPAVDLDTGAGGIDDTVSYTENGAGVAIGSAIDVTDPDAGDNIESATISISNPEAGDLLSVSGALPAGISIDGASTADTLILTGSATPADYATALSQVRFSSSSDDPTNGGLNTARSIGVTVNDGTLNSVPATSTVNLITNDDGAVAQDDDVTTDEATAIIGGDLFADNGNGADTDVDGPPLTVAQVNGSAGNVGAQFTLPSGALLTVNSDGTFDYDPNGAFDTTPTAASGASNQPATDSFTYTLTNGTTATVTVSIGGLDTNDILIDTAGVDNLAGGIGNDRYFVSTVGDSVTELSGEGNDRVFASVTFVLDAGSEVETISTDSPSGTTAIDLTGNEFGNLIVGNAGDNALTGLAGTDILVGSGGDDIMRGGTGAANQMIGGTGNDLYIVQVLGDSLVEFGGEGLDTVLTTLAAFSIAGVGNMERLIGAVGTGQNLTGNDLDNTLAGRAGNDQLFGGLGSDVLVGDGGDDLLAGGTGAANQLIGGTGDDTYILNVAGDSVVEFAGEGIDTVRTDLASYFLRDHSERLVYIGTGNFTGTGNDADNVIIGGVGDDLLDGRLGADIVAGGGGNDRLIGGAGSTNTLIGGTGDDTFVVSVGSDTLVEATGEGTDTVETALAAYQIVAANVENLTYTGAGNFSGIGNGLDNVITGGAGNDLLGGGLGADTLIGGIGFDYHLFNSALGGGNIDQIQGFTHGGDRILLDNAVFTGLTEGLLSANAFVVGTQAGDADDRIIYDAATGALYFDQDGDGAGFAAIQFATVAPALNLTASDFGVI